MLFKELVSGRCGIKPKPSPQFHYIQEWNDEFLSLWPHRFDYIHAEHPEPGHKPNWKTESRHPLSDRLIRQGGYLYGVRFGPKTNYSLLDIDIHSFYHPRQNPFAIERILAALEPLGLISYIACTSSYSGGIHIYFPFEETQNSWDLATCIGSLLENAGFKLLPGHLEVFPNAKAYAASGQPSLYAAHRLPLQAGSYLLDNNWQPSFGDQSTFVRQWRFAQARNDINAKILKQLLKQSRRKHHYLSGRADKFLNDLNGEIEPGWTSAGQTNHILGKIATRSYVFGHVLYASQPLKGQDLVDDIIKTATALPGYSDYCNHQQEIRQKAEEWARCVENSHYFHYGAQKGKYKAKTEEKPQPDREPKPWDDLGWNEYQKKGARERIQQAIADLLNLGKLPMGISERANALLEYGLRRETLYKHKDLWHPKHLWITPPDPPPSEKTSSEDLAYRPSSEESHPNFLSTTGVTNTLDKGFSHSVTSDFSTTGVTNALDKASNGFEAQSEPTEGLLIEQLRLDLRQTLERIKTRTQREREKAQLERSQQMQARIEASRKAQAEKMKQYLESGDRILVQEALEWLASHPSHGLPE